MFLTGYHGTPTDSANKILKEGRFKLSTKDNDWLGTGIYFYFEFADAFLWKRNDDGDNTYAVVHSVIEIDESQYLDLDSNEGKEIFLDIQEIISEGMKEENMKSTQKNQCAVAQMIWDLEQNIQVMAASFATKKSRFPTMTDARKTRREFCVRDNSSIKCTQLIDYKG